MVIFPLPQNKRLKSPPRLALKRLLKELKYESYPKHKVWNAGIQLTNSVSVNLLPRIIAWLVEHCRRFWCLIWWCCNILFYSNIATNANFSSYFDSQKTKERHGLKIRKLYLIKHILELSSPRHILVSLVSPQTFSKSGLCIIFLLLRMDVAEPDSLCFYIFSSKNTAKFPYKIRYYLFYKMKSGQNI